MALESWETKLGDTIRERREKLGLTLQEAADRYGCGLRWWQALETGRNTSIDVLMKVARVLKTDAWRLLK